MGPKGALPVKSGAPPYADAMRFSERTAWEAGLNEWAARAETMRAGGRDLIDMTVSNPTTCGLGPEDPSILAPLSAREALTYKPDPLGMLQARKAVATYYRDHEAEVSEETLCLTTSTSEAYAFLFRLLCDPGDEVLIARPSYPLFDLLAQLQDVQLREYALFCEPGGRQDEGDVWSIDFQSLERAVSSRTRAIIVVHPNNPTGSYVRDDDRLALETLCAERQLALIVDEVFLDYSLATAPVRSFATGTGCLSFVLSGVSKVCALPQMKVSWLCACGPAPLVSEAMRRLEIIADTFLSLGAPAQYALPFWLGARGPVQAAIRARMAENLRVLDARLHSSQAQRLGLQGGWTAVLRVPRQVDGKEFSLAAMHRGVLVQPGSVYGLPEGRCVVSLLTDPIRWEQGLLHLPV